MSRSKITEELHQPCKEVHQKKVQPGIKTGLYYSSIKLCIILASFFIFTSKVYLLTQNLAWINVLFLYIQNIFFQIYIHVSYHLSEKQHSHKVQKFDLPGISSYRFFIIQGDCTTVSSPHCRSAGFIYTNSKFWNYKKPGNQ